MRGDLKAMSRDDCRAYLDETTFRLRAKDYAQKYPNWPGSVGLEIEMLPVVPDAEHHAPGSRGPQAPSRVKLHGPAGTSAAIIRAEAKARGWQMTETEDDTGNPMLLKVDLDDGDNISFEPGGQVEFSSKPYPCLSDAVKRMRTVQGILDETFAREGIRFTQVGVNPWHTVAELGLQMPKSRYRAMDKYFSQIGPYGQRMMRQSCTIQVNLDFGPDETTLTRRYLACQLLAPVVTALFANSPVVDRQASGVVGFRSRIWRHTDPTHTGLPGLAKLSGGTASLPQLTRQHCIDSYMDFAMNAAVVFVTGADYRVPEKPVSFGEWVDNGLYGTRPTAEDFATHLSLLFAEVRPRGFLEIRSIDCQPRAFQSVPAVVMTGILYDDKALTQVLELLVPRAAEIPGLLARSELGLAEPTLAVLAKQVLAIAAEGFARQTPCFRTGCSERELSAFREHFTERGRTPADDILDKMRQSGLPFLPYASLKALEESWSALTGC